MRFSKLFGKTLRQSPAEALSISHQLLVRSAMIAQVVAGVYSYLPLGWRALRKIEQVIREEMDAAGGQEMRMPAIQPYELWEQSGRYRSFGGSLFTVTDRRGHRLALGPTHEEVVTDLAHRFVQSYRDLPALVYQIQTKFRDEPRPRGGLLRVREFIMKDLYSFDVDEAGLDESYRKMEHAYHTIYARLGLPAVMVEADSGAIGGKESHEFMVIAENGEDEIVYCRNCGYAANMEKAHSGKPQPEQPAPPSPLEEVATPGAQTIQEVSDFLGIPTIQTLKAVFYTADGELIFAAIRGDLDINETKLKNLLKCAELRLATEEELSSAGLVAGFASPMGLDRVRIVADDSVSAASNLVAGANRSGYHIKNVNYGRDFKADVVADIARAREADPCPYCGNPLSAALGIEVGHIFKLGTYISEKMDAYFLTPQGESRLAVMGCYGIGLGRLLAAVVEYSHDDKGIIWPLSVAPYEVHLCPLYPDKAGVLSAAEELYQELGRDIEVFLDDRDESPGVKLNDADLLGFPLRITVSPRTLQNRTVEVKWRDRKECQFLPLDGAAGSIRSMLAQERAAEPHPGHLA